MNKYNLSPGSGLQIIILFLFVIASNVTRAQYTCEIDKTTRLEKVGVKDGLSTEYTNCIHQDKYGFIWIGSQIGLNLFDGYRMEVFTADPKNPESLTHNHITGIFEEEDGTMWFCSLYGLSKFNRSNHTFTNYIPDTINISSKINRIKNIVQQDGNYLWLDAIYDLFLFNKETGQFRSFAKDSLDPTKGMYGIWPRYTFIDKVGTFWHVSAEPDKPLVISKFNKESQTFTHFVADPDDPESFENFDVKSMIEDKDGTIWLATNGGGLLEIVDKQKGKFRRYLHDDSDTNSIISNFLLSVFEDSKGIIWVGGSNGLCKLDKENGLFINYPIPKRKDNSSWVNAIENITEDENGNLWLSAYEGFFRFNPSKEEMFHYLNDPFNENSLSQNIVKQVIHDHSWQTWIVTGDKGVNKINQFSNIFRRVQKKNHIDNSLSSNYIARLLVDSRENFWLGCYSSGGLNRTRMNKNKVFENFKHYEFDEDDPTSINSNDIWSMYEDHDHILWIGTANGLNRYDYTSNSFTNFQHDSEDSTTISSNAIETMFEDSHGTFWVGTRNGLNIMDRVTGSFFRLLPEENNSKSISSSNIREIFEDSHGKLWFGGKNLDRLVRKDTSFVSNNIASKLGATMIYDIKEDESSNLWIASLHGGLFKMDRKTNAFNAITVEDGLPSNYINGIEIDNNGDIWASSNKGLSRVNYETHEIKNFDIADGLLNMEIIDRSTFLDKDGWIYFGTRDGLNYFHPDSLKENTHIPPVHITGLKIAEDQQYFDQPLFEMDKVELNYNENDISFDFVALDYINPQKNRYAFMLEGYDEDWNYVGNRRTAYYTNLSPGKYTFRVKGSNNDGYWNEEGASLEVTIDPPFWATWWAYSLYIILFLIVILSIRRNELKKARLQQNLELEKVRAEEMSKLDTEKNRFFSNISHEFRTPLTLILGPLEKILTRKNESEEKNQLNLVRRNARRLQTLINQLLSLSKLESGNMQLKAKPVDLVRLGRVFIQSFDSLAESRGITLSFTSEMNECIVYLDTLKFEKIANNLLSNAFKFTEKGGKIQVSLRSSVNSLQSGEQTKLTADRRLPTADSIELKFSDTGIGIRKEKLPHIFDRFYQVDEEQMKTYLGTGIGLALTKELVELHHGNISVESEPGFGTTFIVTLPLGKEHLDKSEIVSDDTASQEMDEEMLEENYVFSEDVVSKAKAEDQITDENLPLVLLVEDNNDMRAYIKSYLTNDYNIIEAINGKEGAEKAIEHIPDLIVSDLMMPLVDGHEMTTQLKQDERTSHIPIVLLTAKAGTESKIEGLETGADDFLTKPFDAKELLVRIKNLIVQRQRLRKLLSDHVGDVEQTKLIKQSVGPAMNKLDAQFLEKAKTVVDKHLSDSEFTVEQFASEMTMSRVQLHRKLKGLADHSPSDFIRDIRLTKAAELLRAGELNVTEISYEIGISSLSYFSRAFKDKFGVSPSDYL